MTASSPSPEQSEPAAEQPRVIRLRIAPWDAVCTAVLLVLGVVVATTTDWWPSLFGFLADVCVDDECPPAPFGINYYIYPVAWGGIGAAVAAAVIGPLVSLAKGWYMSFWMPIAIAIVLLSALVGSILSSVV